MICTGPRKTIRAGRAGIRPHFRGSSPKIRIWGIIFGITQSSFIHHTIQMFLLKLPPPSLTQPVGPTHSKRVNHGSTNWKVLILWKYDSNVAMWGYNWRRNISHCMFRVQPERVPTKCKVDRLMALDSLDICDRYYYWFVLCCSLFRRILTTGFLCSWLGHKVCAGLQTNFL